MLADFLRSEMVVVKKELKNWKEAVIAGGDLLNKAGKVQNKYKDKMIDNIKDNGPYIVIASGLAIPHARPEAGVIEDGISILTLKNSVQFGHPEYDPVDIIITFAARDTAAHNNLTKLIAEFLDSEKNLEVLRSAQDKAEILNLIKN